MLRKLSTAATIVALMFAFTVTTFAQVKTKEELKAERDALKSELKAPAEIERQAKIESLQPPKTSGVKSVDDLATSSAAFLLAAKDNNKVIPEMYKRTIGETIDGVTDLTVKKPSLDELVALGSNISTQIAAVQKSSDAVQAAADDVKKASPLQAGKATKALGYTKDALALLGPELQLNLKTVNHLITTVKSTKNY